MSAVIADQNLYLPQMGRIVAIEALTPREKYFRVELEQPLGHGPGQFVMVSIPGIGESAISITCGPRDDNILEIVIRRAGSVTGVIHGLKEGDYLGIRGPYGHGFPMDEFDGKDVLFVAGGLGLVPLRSLILPVVEQKARFGNVTLITGARNPAEALFRDELVSWATVDGVEVFNMVDRTDEQPWKGRVGLVTQPIGDLKLDRDNTVVVLCGPPVMYKFVMLELQAHHQIPNESIFLDLERRMKCGVGKCGHCQINSLYCCQEGPVFRYSDLINYPEAMA
jgi:NAD(P)H-flavin reductase